MNISLPDPLILIIFIGIVIVVLRGLFSWWLRTNEIVNELRTLNKAIAKQNELLGYIHRNTMPTPTATDSPY